jgi:hypothetical protein
MKKALSIILMAVIILGLSACGTDEPNTMQEPHIDNISENSDYNFDEHINSNNLNNTDEEPTTLPPCDVCGCDCGADHTISAPKSKLEQNKPQFWSVQTTSTSITVGVTAKGNGIGELLYAWTKENIEPEIWYTSNIFSNLTPNTTYYIWCVQLGNDYYSASENVVISVTTKKSQDMVDKIAQNTVTLGLLESTPTSVTVQAVINGTPMSVNNFVYACLTGDLDPNEWRNIPNIAWTENATFTDLQPLTRYHFLAYKPGDDYFYDSNLGIMSIYTLED